MCTVNKAGLVISQKPIPYQSRPAELIVIPRSHAFTFAMALHVKLDHPNISQMQLQFGRQYFMLDEAKTLRSVFDSCDYPCQASRLLPRETMTFTTETKAESPGHYLNADVMVESSQKILLVRDNLTSYTATDFVKNEQKETIKEALFTLCSRLRLGPSATVRVDGQSSLASLQADGSLQSLGIVLEIGHAKNPNKNSPAEKAIRELREQVVKISPHGGPISCLTLARATENLNNLIRHTGRSAKELWTSRDRSSGQNLQLNDKAISDLQHNLRQSSHSSSALYSSRNAPEVVLPNIKPGDQVVIKSDRSKSKARDTFNVLLVDPAKKTATLQKFPMENFRRNPLTVQLQNILPLPSNRQAELPTYLPLPVALPLRPPLPPVKHRHHHSQPPSSDSDDYPDSEDEQHENLAEPAVDYVVQPVPPAAEDHGAQPAPPAAEDHDAQPVPPAAEDHGAQPAPPAAEDHDAQPVPPAATALEEVQLGPQDDPPPEDDQLLHRGGLAEQPRAQSPHSRSPSPSSTTAIGPAARGRPHTQVMEACTAYDPNRTLPVPDQPAPKPLRRPQRPRERWVVTPRRRRRLHLIQPKAKSAGYMAVGDYIVIYHATQQQYVQARLLSHTGNRGYSDSSYRWTWQFQDNTTDSGLLLQGARWGVIADDNVDPETSLLPFDIVIPNIAQVDGDYTPDSHQEAVVSTVVARRYRSCPDLTSCVPTPSRRLPACMRLKPINLSYVEYIDPAWGGADEPVDPLPPRLGLPARPPLHQPLLSECVRVRADLSRAQHRVSPYVPSSHGREEEEGGGDVSRS